VIPKENITSLAGIDYSITSPAVAVYTGIPVSTGLIPFKEINFLVITDKKPKQNLENALPNVFLIPHKKKDIFMYEIERFMHNAEKVVQFIDWYKSKITTIKVLIEDYAMGAKGRTFAIGENTAILKYNLFHANIPYNTIAPTVIKKYATGKGNANKDAMYSQFILDTNITNLKRALIGESNKLESPVTDIVDAYYLLNYLNSNYSLMDNKGL